MLVSILFAAPWWSPAASAAPGKARARAAEPVQAKATAVRAGDPVAGRDKAEAERCIECHGLDGNGAGEGAGQQGKFAKLAGQYPGYILKQIQDFRSGARKHDQMAIMARSVSDDDLIDIAAYFAGLPRMTGQDGKPHEPAQTLFDSGDAARGIAACASCHGAKGQGLASNLQAPIIGGQEWRYLDKQLRDWRSGERRNGPDAAMNQVAARLTDKEIESLADLLAGQ